MATIKFENSVKLDHLLSTNKKAKEAFNRIIAAVMLRAREDAVAAIEIGNDPLRARQAVHVAIYKKCFGGNLNLYPRKRREGNASVRSSSRGRSAETERLMKLKGYDRSFVLNILNTGTPERVARTMNNHTIHLKSPFHRSGNRVYKSKVLGYRGIIPGRGFFASAANYAIEKNVAIFQKQIEEEILKIINSH